MQNGVRLATIPELFLPVAVNPYLATVYVAKIISLRVRVRAVSFAGRVRGVRRAACGAGVLLTSTQRGLASPLTHAEGPRLVTSPIGACVR